MFSGWIRLLPRLRRLVPLGWRRWLRKSLKPNFLMLHYFFILLLSIVGSIILFASGGLTYIDALFLATSGATSTGLNTVDINKLNTFQQVVLYVQFLASNTIVIHTFLVYVRIYWFEKRFQHVVKEARRYRRTRSRSRTETRDYPDPAREVRGVVGKSIVVLHNKPNGPAADDKPTPQPGVEAPKPSPDDSSGSSVSSLNGGIQPPVQESEVAAPVAGPSGPLSMAVSVPAPNNPPFRREIVFADEVKATDEHRPAPIAPHLRSTERHIAVLENQRNPKDKSTLRIPGPRDFDRGERPQEVNDDAPDTKLARQRTAVSEHGIPGASALPDGSAATLGANSPGPAAQRSITIEEPNSPRTKSTGQNQPSTALHHRRPSLAAAPSLSNPLFPAPSRARTTSSFQRTARDAMPYLSWAPTVGRNSAFVDLTEDQRDELGGIEYRALKSLAYILVGYYACFHLLAVTLILPWILKTDTYGSVVEQNGQSRVWWGIFTPASMLNNVGFTLTPDSMVSFQKAIYVLLIGFFLIIVGNTGFPVMLRFILWTGARLVPHGSHFWEELQFLLDHPRRCFTLLFPRRTTLWLLLSLFLMNGLDVMLFIVLDFKKPFLMGLSGGTQFVDGLFQATNTRTTGMTCVSLGALHAGVQVSFLIMMYISVFPVAISVRATNVYEEKSLGIYSSAEDEAADGSEPSYTGAHLRRQLSFDLWYIFLGLFFIAIIEGGRIEDIKDYSFTTYACLFEAVSAYANIGLSLGYPNANYSFSGEFKVLTKLVIIAMMFRGRHRGLPYALDRAILLPSESLHQKEEREARARLQRRNSNLSGVDFPLVAMSSPPPQQANGFDPDKPMSPEREKAGHAD